ncbi:MAG: CocE/NonD family hydrolase [Bacteroidetes bacterium]|nr:CocE/NonD family hydrolase [Bacteroidota bacterium]
MKVKFLPLLFLAFTSANCQEKPKDNFVRDHYNKMDTLITMRDGVRLYTVIYSPKDQTEKYPILMERTPYSAGPYGNNQYASQIGPDSALMHQKYIFVYQDVRGRYMSEGINLEVTPYIENKKSKQDVDESSDTWDTVDWLIHHIKNNNGRVGLYGISYPGFYATASLPGAHPAIKAVSPQAPVTDEFIGDDANHQGAFFLMDNFDFMNYYGKERKGPVEDYGSNMFQAKRTNAYDFFLQLGPIKNTQSATYFNHRSYIWNEYLQHDTYDTYWQKRNIRQYLKNIKIPVLVVGGWYDAEDLFGALHTYKAIEDQSPQNKNFLVMGPWTHGAWASRSWNTFGPYQFGSNTNEYFRDSLLTRFFNYYLKDQGDFNAREATIFETGTNQWKHFNQWPPKNIQFTDFYLGQNHTLTTDKTLYQNGYDEYISDPANPVPYTGISSARRNNEYMAEDERFASKRNDVLSFASEPLQNDLTIAGPLLANLEVSISTTDADFIVKLIDVFPGDASASKNIRPGKLSSIPNAEMMVRAEVLRGKFRNSFSNPEAFIPGQVSQIKISMNDICHTFLKGHRIMVQVQSSWFPLVDRNPQQFLCIPDANERDFIKSSIKLYHDGVHISKISLPILNKNQ